MKTRNLTLLLSMMMVSTIGVSGVIGAQDSVFVGRRADHMPLHTTPATERAEFAAFDASSQSVRAEPAYSGRRADHMPMLLLAGKERAEFAAMEGYATKGAAPARSEMAYGGRRVDHLEMLRNSEER